ncbi:hypothetical protein [Streptomyces sp. NPDC006274]|uniref:hypothetical protein n=1 Tax=unclassified Streptomyces TaxID=2593676 RepID=UPI0033AF686E
MRTRLAPVARLARTQDGLATYRQLTTLGCAPSTISDRCRPDGPWRRLLPRVVLLQTGRPSPRQRLHTAVLYAGDHALLTGRAALRLYGVRAAGPRERADTVDVVVSDGRNPRGAGYVRVHRTRRSLQGRRIEGLPCATPARASADAVPYLADQREVTALLAEVVQQRRCTVPELAEALRAVHRCSDPRVVATMEGLAAGVRSIAESDARAVLRASPIPPPLWNPLLHLADGTFLACPDAYWPHGGVVLEVDSREWHLNPEGWERTMARRNLMTRHGLRVLSVSPSQLRETPGHVLATIQDALAGGAPVEGVVVREVQETG